MHADRVPDLEHLIPDRPPARCIGWRTFLGFVWQAWRANLAAHRATRRLPHKFEIRATLPIPWH